MAVSAADSIVQQLNFHFSADQSVSQRQAAPTTICVSGLGVGSSS